MLIQGFAPQVLLNRNFSGVATAVERQDSGNSVGVDSIALSDRASAMSTNANVNRVLSQILGSPAASSGNSAANAFQLVNSPAPQSAAATAAARTPVQNLMAFGGDRKTAIETLIASGAKAENPKLPFVKNVMRKVLGGTKTSSKAISPNQSIATKVKVKSFNLKALRLTTKGTPTANGQTVRHVDFATQTPTNRKAQVKDIGTVIGKGTPTRMIEQTIQRGGAGQQPQITNNYFDPKTGQNFMRTNEQANRIETDKMGLTKSHKDKSTRRQIELLGADGQPDQRYVFDYRAKSIRLENLNDAGQVVSSQSLSKKTDYFKLVDRLSMNPPSGSAASVASPVAAGGGGGRLENAHVQMV
jgi:hypothetical protein